MFWFLKRFIHKLHSAWFPVLVSPLFLTRRNTIYVPVDSVRAQDEAWLTRAFSPSALPGTAESIPLTAQAVPPAPPHFFYRTPPQS